MPISISSTVYADHLRGCADLAKEIAARMDIRDDAARQAMLATLIISADRHNLFLEPTPQHSKAPTVEQPKQVIETPVKPEPAASNGDIKKGVNQDEAAARKADAQIQDTPRTVTPEQSDGAKRGALLQAIDQGRTLLNKAGYLPIMTPKALNAVINDEMKIPGNLGTLDMDQLEAVVKMLSDTLDTFKSNMKVFQPDF